MATDAQTHAPRRFGSREKQFMETLDAFKVGSSSPPKQTELEVAVTAAYVDWLNSETSVLKARKTSLEYARELGTLLIQMKSEIDHGAWLPTLKRCGIPIRHAQKSMRIAGANASTLSHLKTVNQGDKAQRTPKSIDTDEREPAATAKPKKTPMEKARGLMTMLGISSAAHYGTTPRREMLKQAYDSAETTAARLTVHGRYPELIQQAQALVEAIASVVNLPDPPKPKGKRSKTVEPEVEPTSCAVPKLNGSVTISASERGGRGKYKHEVGYSVSWTEDDGSGFTQYGFRTLEEAKQFCPCSFDPDTLEHTVIPGVTVYRPIPRGMCGTAGSYRVLDGAVVPGSEIPPNLYPCEEAEEEMPTVEPAVKRRGRPPGSKNRPKVVPESSSVMTGPEAFAILGFRLMVDRFPPEHAEVNKRFRVLSRKAHPDAGGSHEQMARLTQARTLLTRKITPEVRAAWKAQYDEFKKGKNGASLDPQGQAAVVEV